MARRFPASSLPDCGFRGPLSEHPAFATLPLPLGGIAVIACHFNPCGYRRPVDNLRRFLNWTAAQGVPLYMAELTFKGGPGPVLPRNHGRVLQLQTDGANRLFQKEALLNAAATLPPASVMKLVWLDADVLLTNPRWLEFTSAALDSHAVAWPFSRCILTDKDGAESKAVPSAGDMALARHPRALDWKYSHPGYGGAARRDWLAAAGGLWPYAIAGHGDTVFTLGLCGQFQRSRPSLAHFSDASYASAAAWAAGAFGPHGSGFSVVPGDAVHLWHGSGVNRAYAEKLRWMSGFDPARHVTTRNGPLEWADAAFAEIPETIAGLAASFNARREDD